MFDAFLTDETVYIALGQASISLHQVEEWNTTN